MNEKIKQFLDDENAREALRLLLLKCKEIDTVRGVQSYTELQANKKAINIIEDWVEELFGIARGEWMETKEDEDPLIRYKTEE